MDGITLKSRKGAIALPCMNVKIVPIDQVQANNYNPNAVAKHNMLLLQESILNNGFCYPVATIWDPDVEKYVIVDGFHRYTILKDYLGCEEIPIEVLDHDAAQRMIATVQFNRARGVHQVEHMGKLVASLIGMGLSDDEVAEKMGMELEEVMRLKQNTGIAELFKNQNYSSSWGMVEVTEDA